MSELAAPSYAFGDSEIARERLAIVADVFEDPTRRLLADLPPMQPRYVVDMGCGPGHVSAAAAAHASPSSSLGWSLPPIDAFRVSLLRSIRMQTGRNP